MSMSREQVHSRERFIKHIFEEGLEKSRVLS